MFGRIRDLMGGTEGLRGTGLRGSAEVLEVVQTGRTVGLENSVPMEILRARLRIALPDAEPYEIAVETTSVPPAGTVAPVWVDPKRADRVFVDVMALAEEQAAQAQQMAAQLAQQFVTPPAGPDLVSNLERLTALRDSGAISEEEFAAAKAQLLGD